MCVFLQMSDAFHTGFIRELSLKSAIAWRWIPVVGSEMVYLLHVYSKGV